MRGDQCSAALAASQRHILTSLWGVAFAAAAWVEEAARVAAVAFGAAGVSGPAAVALPAVDVGPLIEAAVLVADVTVPAGLAVVVLEPCAALPAGAAGLPGGVAALFALGDALPVAVSLHPCGAFLQAAPGAVALSQPGVAAPAEPAPVSLSFCVVPLPAAFRLLYGASPQAAPLAFVFSLPDIAARPGTVVVFLESGFAGLSSVHPLLPAVPVS